MADRVRKVRAFVSVELPDELKAALQAFAGDIRIHGLRAIAPEQMHLTLFFLGKISEGQLGAVGSALSELDHRSFNVSIDGLGAFLKHGHGVLYADIGKGAGQLGEIYRRLAPKISGCGINLEERSFNAHITIARMKGLGDSDVVKVHELLGSNKDMEFGQFVCRLICLKESETLPSGAVHTTVYSKELPS